MRLSGVREGDIVRVDDGMPYYALVLDIGQRELVVRPLYGDDHRRRRVRAGEVVGHWRQSRARAQAAEAHAA